MINSIDTYKDAGRKAGEARNQRDESRAQFHHNWFNRAEKLEQGDDRRDANKAFRDAYCEARSVRFSP